jgi:hypothetical protein
MTIFGDGTSARAKFHNGVVDLELHAVVEFPNYNNHIAAIGFRFPGLMLLSLKTISKRSLT